MAETEIIITKFEGDLSGLDQTVTGYEGAMADATAANKSFEKSSESLGGSVGKLGPKFEAVKQSAQRNRKELDLTGKSINDLKRQLDTLTKGRATLIDPKAIAKTNADIAQVRSQITKLETSVAGAGKLSKDLFGAITQGASQAVPGVSGILGSFSGMAGPIGIASAAVAGFFANFSRLDSVKVFFDAVSIGFDQIGDRLANLDFRGFFDPKTQAQDAAFAVKVAKLTDAIEEAQLGVNKANAEAELQIAGLNQKLRDGTKTYEDRLAIAAEVASIEQKRAAQEQFFIRLQVAAQKDINAQQLAALGEVSDANKAALNEREIALLQSQQRTVELTETTERRRNSILEQGASERQALDAKEQAAREKAQKEFEQRESQRAQFQKGIDDTLNQLAQEASLSRADDAQKEVLGIENKFSAIAAKTREGFEKLRALTPPGGQAELAQREADAIIAIETAKNEQLAALEKARADNAAKTQEENLERLRKTLLTETEIQRDAALQRLDADLSLAETTLATAEERDAFRLERVKQTEKELSLILTEEQKARLDAEKAALEERQKLQEEETQMLLAAADDSIAVITQAALAGESLNENAAKVLMGIFLDTLEKLVLGQALAITAGSTAQGAQVAGAPGALAGLAAGAAIAGIIKGLFAVLKAQIAGAYTGEEYVTGKQTWAGRDGHLRRLHEGERVVTAKDNKTYWGELEAMRKGNYADHIEAKYIAPALAALNHRDDARVNDFLSSDSGQRIASSVMLAKFYDANIVGALARNGKQTKLQTQLLEQLVRQSKPVSVRYR